MSNPKPHIVLVHGAFHSPPHYAPLLDALKSHGYTTHTAQLPSVGSLDPPKDLSQDIAAVRELLAEATETDNDVVVICHSWGGIVSGSALVGWSKAEREAAGKQGGVVRAGYIAAMMLDEGVSMADTLPPGGHPPWAEQTDVHVSVKPDCAGLFYNGLPESEQKHWSGILQTHGRKALEGRTEGASWKTIPTSYLLCEDDKVVPPQGQEGVIQRASDAGATIEVTRIVSGHSPFLSMVEETVEWVRGVCGEDVGKK